MSSLLLVSRQLLCQRIAARSSWCPPRLTPAAARAAAPLHHANNALVVLVLDHDPTLASVYQAGVRWKRRDGNRWATYVKPPTKKQRQAHARKMAKLQAKTARHGAPGSKAGPRRDWEQVQLDQLLQRGEYDKNDTNANDKRLYGSEHDEYTVGDALLEDIIGNVQEAAPTPEPAYFGRDQRKYFNIVADHMDDYHRAKNSNHNSSSSSNPAQQQQQQLPQQHHVVELPRDRDIANALKAFRDVHGTRQSPVGVVKALSHLLQDLQLPLSALAQPGSDGEYYTYSALLSCCRSPPEARRVLQLMADQGVTPTSWHWSILVDVHAKIGDYQGCVRVHQEMLKQQHGVSPTLASYTSLLAACYKVCNNGRAAHAVRAECAQVAWETWQEMRIVGLEPDAMSYGAILRIFAAQGQGEKALSMLHEMQQMQVAPTTLCFTSALRAVARSHATAIRYERGSSRRHRRREHVAAHHGKLARSILILAESAGVDQDAGFVAALALCAAEAGDVATCKAIATAADIRRLDWLRTVGTDAQLARLRGETTNDSDESNTIDMISSSSSSALASDSTNGPRRSIDKNETTASRGGGGRRHSTYGEREYGRDSRTLTAILHACAKAADMNGIGSIWQGRENQGYLCINSLRLIEAAKVPRYTNNDVPGTNVTTNLTWKDEDKDETVRGKRQKRKYDGIVEDEKTGGTLDDLDEQFINFFVNDDGTLKDDYRKSTPEDIWQLKYPGDSAIINKQIVEQSPVDSMNDPKTLELMAAKGRAAIERSTAVVPEKDAKDEGMGDSKMGADLVKEFGVVDLGGGGDDDTKEVYFDVESRQWATRPKQDGGDDDASSDEDDDEEDGENDDDAIPEMYFDQAAMRWKTKSDTTPTNPAERTEFESGVLSKITSEEDSATKMPLDDTDSGAKASSSEAQSTVEESNIMTYESSPIGDDDDEEEEGERKEEPIDEAAFALFRSQLQKELAQDGEEDVNDEEARELFVTMKDEYTDVMSMDEEDFDDEDDERQQVTSKSVGEAKIPASEYVTNAQGQKDDSGKALHLQNRKVTAEAPKQQFDDLVDGLLDKWDLSEKKRAATTSNGVATTRQVEPFLQDDFGASAIPQQTTLMTSEGYHEQSSQTRDDAVAFSAPDMDVMEGAFTETVQVMDDDNDMEAADAQLDELRRLLPAFSDTRLKRIQRVFRNNLGDPPMLELIPLVRENMPDYVTNTWLKQMSFLTAKFVMLKAEEEGLVDKHTLTGVLELHASSGSIDRAIDFHESEFKGHELEPTVYCDRLVLQMLVKNNRFTRALVFKQKVEEDGRSLDIKAYGSLVEYCSRRNQLGSAMLLLKECLSVHGAPPGEASLTSLRLLCRQTGIGEEIQIEELIGKDPVEWIRDGEANRKRERSKKGRHGVQQAQNAVVRI